ncbi:MAG: ABC transporter ATP-binding protein [Acidobacteria bacterium]|nr:MAG: ABC transporter ATP-binding protein [Acidobacteriota bacterium]
MSPFRRLFRYAVRYRGKFVAGLACVVVTRSVWLAGPTVLGYAVDDLTRGVTRTKLAAYGALLLAIGCVGGLFQFLQRRIMIGASRDIEYDMRNDFFAHLEKLPLAYFQSHRTGDLMSRATNDLNAVRMMIGPSVMYSANTILTFAVALAVMMSIDPRLTLWSLVPLPFVSISVKYFGSAIHKRFEQIQAQLSEVSAVAQEALSGVRVVRAYRQEDAEIERFRRSNDEYLARNRRLIVIQGFFFPSMSFFLGLGALVVLWLGGRAVIAGRITLGQFVAFNAYLTMLSWPMIAFGWVTNMLQRGMASWKRMLEVLETQPAIADEPTAQRKPEPQSIRGAIEFRDLTFSYGDGARVLQHVSAAIEAGQTAALVGPTGSGKSTLISLLARLHDPPPGTVFIDGVDVPFGLDANDHARAAPSGLPEAGLKGSPYERDRADRIRAAAAVARLDKDVADFPHGYETMVGERGITLSGGQKQRTALARAIVVDPRILILDDALSAVDTYTEEEILSRLRGVMRERTSLIVSHRISTVRDADVIFVLDDGRIAERGTHDALIRRNGLYAALHKKQLLEEELAAS